MTKLKPCPFCEYDDVRIVKDMKDTTTPIYAVVCDECGGIFYTGDMLDMQSVIEEWNTRPNPWHTGTPSEEGDYLVAFRMSDNSVEYGWCNWNNGAWDILCDYDPTNGSCGMVAWMPITHYEEKEK